jgi:hypothetical protein
LILLKSKKPEGTRFEQNQGLDGGFPSARVFFCASAFTSSPQAKDHQSESARRQ